MHPLRRARLAPRMSDRELRTLWAACRRDPAAGRAPLLAALERAGLTWSLVAFEGHVRTHAGEVQPDEPVECEHGRNLRLLTFCGARVFTLDDSLDFVRHALHPPACGTCRRTRRWKAIAAALGL